MVGKKGKIKVGIITLLVLIGIFSSYFVFAQSSFDNVEITYKNNNMTIEFKDDAETIGQATLKSHKTYDEILKVTSGKNRTIIWYEFSDFKEIQNALGEVEFIDMKKMILNEISSNESNGSLEFIENTNYLKPVNKTYHFVYLKDGEWIDHNFPSIPKENITIGVQIDLGWGEILDVRLNILGKVLERHAVVEGTNAGFVTEAPEADPSGDGEMTVEKSRWALKTTSPAGASKITEVGWWCTAATAETNFEVGLYNHDAGEDLPNALLQVDRINAKGTTEGWKTATVDWDITEDTIYWLALQVDASTGTNTDRTINAAHKAAAEYSYEVTTLDDPWGTTYATFGRIFALYAVWEEELDTTPPNVTINTPLPQTYTTTTITFNVTALDDIAMKDCNYTLNNGLTNFTMSNSSTSPTCWIATNSTMNEGGHEVIYHCWDTTGNLNNSESVSFFIDSIAPNTTKPILNSTDGTNKSNQNLNCYATLTDNIQTNLIANWTWYKNNVSNLSGSTSVQSGDFSLITTLDAGNITKGENWICEVTPYDGYNYGTAKNSSAITILNSVPEHINPILTTPNNKNLSRQNLTCTNKSTSDGDGDEVINIYNWYKNSQPFTILNMPFEINVNDYSGNDNDGTNYGADFVDSKEGLGNALSFDGIDDYVKVTKNFGTSFNTFSAEAWVNLKNIATEHRYILERDDTHFYISVTPDRKIRFRHVDLTNGETETEANATEFNEWTHIAVVYDGAKTYIYVNGELKKEQEDTGDISFSATEPLYVGSSKYATSYPDRTWNGSIDEIRIYNKALTSQQVSAHYVLEYNKIASQETSGGDEWMCQVTPNDAEEDGDTLNSSELEVLWAITFNVTSGEDGSQLNNFNINCNNSWSVTGADSFEEFGFEDGSYECKFTKFDFFDETINFNADNDKTINIILSRSGFLSNEEHTWLEAIYNCVVLGDCSLYNLLLEINSTVGNIWEHTKPTDESVITYENVTNKVINSSNNLTIDYTVNIPVKAGYSLGAYLPIRIGYWFLDENNETCYNQGDKPTGVEEPYCQPLIIETLGPMGGEVNFTVELHPSLPAGDYSIKRIIDIDPNNIWINYGQEIVSSFTMLEGLSTYGISAETTGEVMPEKEGILQNLKSGITGAVTGVRDRLLSGWQLVIVIGMLVGLFALHIISRTILKLKGR